ncbi:MAG TPA: hypothetical protein VHN79_10810 [Lacunisphaera sp.]|nr:hypothetical protein [Lacunisphaera sp.]
MSPFGSWKALAADPAAQLDLFNLVEGRLGALGQDDSAAGSEIGVLVVLNYPACGSELRIN